MKNFVIGFVLIIVGAFSCIAFKHYTDNKLLFVIAFAIIIIGGLFQLSAFVEEKRRMNEQESDSYRSRSATLRRRRDRGDR
jgi:cytochrome c biogenesis protein CcdA